MTPKRRKKRPYGTGSVERLPSGRWRATTPDRRRQTFATEYDAHAWLDRIALTSPIDTPIRVARGALRLRDMAEEHLADLERQGATKEHVRGRRSHLRIVVDRWGDLLLDRIDGPTMERLVREMSDLGWSPATISNRLEAVTGPLRLAMRLGWTPARDVPVRRPRRTLASRPPRLSADDVERLLEEARSRGLWFEGVVTLALGAGLRRGELYRFRRVDLRGGRSPAVVVPVRDSEDRPKSGRERWVPIGSEIARVVRSVPGDQPFAVPGGPIEMDRRARPMFVAAGLGGVRWHRLRHTWASEMADAGARLMDLMEWGGWASPAMVRRYFHAAANPEREAADAIAGRLGLGRTSHENPTKKKKPRR